MRFITVMLVVMAIGALVTVPLAGQTLLKPPALTPEQMRILYPWAFGPSRNQIPMDRAFPVGQAKNLPDDGKDKTLNAAKQGSLPTTANLGRVGDLTPRWSQGSIDWANDVLVRRGSVPTNGKLSMDHSTNGHLFIMLLSPFGDDLDTAWVYRSIDGGRTWTWWIGLVGDTLFGRITDVEIRVGSEPSNPFIYLWTLRHHKAFPGLWCIRVRENYTQQLQTIIALGGDTMSQISADRDNASPYNLYTTYKGNGGNLFGIRSTNNDSTWEPATWISDSANTHSEMAMGGGGNFYVTYQVDTTTIRIGRCTNYLTGSWKFNDITGQGISEWWPTVAASRTGDSLSQTAWVVFRNVHDTGGIDTHYGRSTNAGATWSAAVWQPTNLYPNAQPNFPHARVGYEDTAHAVSVVEPIFVSSPYDSIVFAWASEDSPTVWRQRTILNNHPQTSEFGPKTDFPPIGPVATYREGTSDSVWFDAYGFSGVEEGKPLAIQPVGPSLDPARPNPVSHATTITFSLPKTGDVELALYDVSGRKIGTLAKGTMPAGSHEVRLDGAKVPPGIYFYRLSFEGKALTNRMVAVR